MKALERKLKRSAEQSAEWRGHHLSTQWEKIGKHTWRKSCRRLLCGMEVFVDTDPCPNVIDICGEAVALNCKGGGLP